MSRAEAWTPVEATPRAAMGESPLEVVYVIDSLVSGGAQRQAVETAVNLVSRGAIRASFLVYHDIGFYEPRLREAGVEVAVVDKGQRYDIGFPWRLRDRIRRIRPALVHAFMIAPAAWAALAIRLLPLRERPAFVASERNSLVAANLQDRFAQTFAYRSSDCVTVNSTPVAEEIHCKLGVARSRIEYIPNGIDLERWDHERREPCGIPFEGDGLNLGCIGRLTRQKNHLVLLDALERLPPALRERTRLWLMGNEPGAYARRVRCSVKERGLEKLVRFVRPIRSIAGAIERMDGLVLASSWEGFPNVVLEGMATEKTVVATSVGDVPSILEDGRTGLVVPPDDAPALARALRTLHEMSQEERRALGRRARATVEKRYRMEQVADCYRALYERLAR